MDEENGRKVADKITTGREDIITVAERDQGELRALFQTVDAFIDPANSWKSDKIDTHTVVAGAYHAVRHVSAAGTWTEVHVVDASPEETEIFDRNDDVHISVEVGLDGKYKEPHCYEKKPVLDTSGRSTGHLQEIEVPIEAFPAALAKR